MQSASASANEDKKKMLEYMRLDNRIKLTQFGGEKNGMIIM